MKKTLVILVGESGTGKDTVFKLLSEKYNFEKKLSHLTRPLRPDEVDGVDVISESSETFVQQLRKGNVFAHTKVDGFDYWKSKSDLLNIKNKAVCILEPTGVLEVASELCKVRSIKEMRVVIIRLQLCETERFKRMIESKEENIRFTAVTIQNVLDRMARDKNNFEAIDLEYFSGCFPLVEAYRCRTNVSSERTASFVNELVKNLTDSDVRNFEGGEKSGS